MTLAGMYCRRSIWLWAFGYGLSFVVAASTVEARSADALRTLTETFLAGDVKLASQFDIISITEIPSIENALLSDFQVTADEVRRLWVDLCQAQNPQTAAARLGRLPEPWLCLASGYREAIQDSNLVVRADAVIAAAKARELRRRRIEEQLAAAYVTNLPVLFSPRRDQLAKDPCNAAAQLFFKVVPFSKMWPLVEKSEDRLRMRYLLLLFYFNRANAEAKDRLLSFKIDDVIAEAEKTYWPVNVPIVDHEIGVDTGADRWRNLASEWDGESRMLNTLAFGMAGGPGSFRVIFHPLQQYIISDAGREAMIRWDGKRMAAGGEWWTIPHWPEIIGYHRSLWAAQESSDQTSAALPLLTSASVTEEESVGAPLTRRCRLAVVAAPVVRGTGLQDLAGIRFQDIANVESVNRDEIDKVMNEQGTAATFGGGSNKERLLLGRLLHADTLVLLSVETHGGKTVMKQAVCDSASGALLSLAFRAWPSPNIEKQADEVVRSTVAALRRFPRGVERMVGVAPFRCRNLNFEYDYLQSAYTRLVQMGLTRIPGVAVVEIEEARAIRQELELTGVEAQNRPKPLFVEGEFECMRKVPDAEPRVTFTVRGTDGAHVLKNVERRDISAGDVPLFLTRDCPREVLNGQTATNATSVDSPEVQFKMLVSIADLWERLDERAKAMDLREAAVLIKPDAMDQRLALTERQTKREPRFGHLEFLIRRGMVPRAKAIALSPAVHGSTTPKPLPWFTQRLKESMARERERKLDFLSLVYPLVLRLPSDAANRIAEVQQWRSTLFALTTEETDIRSNVIARLVIPDDLPPEDRFLLTFQLKTGDAGPLWDNDGISDQVRSLAYSREPIALSLLARFRESPRSIDRFYAHKIDMTDTNQSPKDRVVHATAVLESLSPRSAILSQKDQFEIRRSATTIQSEQADRIIPTPYVFGLREIPFRYPAPGYPIPTPAQKAGITFEDIPVQVRRPSGKLEVLRKCLVKNILNCGGVFEVFWSDRAVYFQRERGVFSEIFTGELYSFRDVIWDGRSVWVSAAQDGIRVLSPEGQVLRTIGAADGLPSVADRLYPVAQDTVLAVGRVSQGNQVRTWCAMVSVTNGAGRVNVFHEARRVKTALDKDADAIMDSGICFKPALVWEVKTNTQDRILYVGRDVGWEFRQANAYPLRVTLRTLEVSVAPPQPVPPPELLPEPYEKHKAAILDPNGWGVNDYACGVSIFLGAIQWRTSEGRFRRVSLGAPSFALLPLYVAAEKGDMATVLAQIKGGAAIDAGDHMSPLSWAAARGHADVVKVLLDNGANPNFKNELGLRPLHCPVRGKAQPRAAEILRMLLDRGADATAKDERGLTPLISALLTSHYAEAEALVLAGVELKTRDTWGRSPLHVACEGGIAILQANRDADAQKFMGTQDVYTPYHQQVAREGCRTNVIRFLLQKGADVNTTDEYGRTPLHMAAASTSGQPQLVTLLLDAHADIETKDTFGDTPLHKAVWTRNPVAVAALIERGAAVNAQDSSGRTPLYWAKARGFTEIANILSRHGGGCTSSRAGTAPEPGR